MPDYDDLPTTREEVHLMWNLRWLESPLKNFRDGLEFIYPMTEDEKKKLVVRHPPENFGDLTSNILKVADMKSFRVFYPTDDDFIWAVEAYAAPCDKVEVVNGMLNVWLKQELLVENVKQVAFIARMEELWEWFLIKLVQNAESLQ